MADPNEIVHYYNDTHGAMQTFGNMVMSEESLGFAFEDFGHPFGENIVNEDGNNTYPNNQFVNDTSQAGTSGVKDQSNGPNAGYFNPESSNLRNPIQLSEWPVPPNPYACTCCRVLREIIHTNGGETTKLELHGRLGVIYHGILEICRGDMTAPNKTYQMFDFCKDNIHGVKQFLVQYCEERTEADYTMVKDPLLTFYQALCVGLDVDCSFDFDDLFRGSPVHIVENKGKEPETITQPSVCRPRAHVHQPPAQRNEGRSTRNTLSEQREVAKTLTGYDFVHYFHLPVDTAARQIGVCSSVIKKICRKYGLKRWPHRKIHSIRTKIEYRNKRLNTTTNAGERARVEADIQKLNQELSDCYAILVEKIDSERKKMVV